MFRLCIAIIRHIEARFRYMKCALTNILLYWYNTTEWLLSNSMLVKLTPSINIGTSEPRLWNVAPISILIDNVSYWLIYCYIDIPNGMAPLKWQKAILHLRKTDPFREWWLGKYYAVNNSALWKYFRGVKSNGIR